MARTQTRLRVDDVGSLEVVDPGFDSLDLLQALDPQFRIRRAPLPGFSSPRFMYLREVSCDVPAPQLITVSEDALWHAHGAAMHRLRDEKSPPVQARRFASLFDLKIELARRVLASCRFCHHRCGVDRSRGALGVCRLGTEATVAEHFVHIAEEAPINPSLVLNLAGCGLRCRFCQQSALLTPAAVSGEPLAPGLWPRLRTTGARSLSFVGGNPDESLYAILQFLAAAPSHWRLPIVWNCHAYATLETLSLLDGVVDAYVPDFKYGNEACGRHLSAVRDYPATARAAITAMLTQGVPVFVRLLVVPGHIECCHAPTLNVLATLQRDWLCVSVRGQYAPDWQITPGDGALARRPTQEEIEAVRDKVRSLGLTLIDAP